MSMSADRHRRVPTSRATVRAQQSARDKSADAMHYGSRFARVVTR